jgi:hypothetical protein
MILIMIVCRRACPARDKRAVMVASMQLRDHLLKGAQEQLQMGSTSIFRIAKILLRQPYTDSG